MIWVSLLVVGPFEEYIFRGFVFGGLVDLFGEVHWVYHALLASALFAAVHLYYALVYGAASLIPLTDLITFGLAMAFTYYSSGGNILVPALIHGVFDAAAFVNIASSTNDGTLLRSSLTLLGIIIAVILFIQKFVRSHRVRPD
jgi:membrane protease YdiL (CAAX protease family)